MILDYVSIMVGLGAGYAVDVRAANPAELGAPRRLVRSTLATGVALAILGPVPALILTPARGWPLLALWVGMLSAVGARRRWKGDARVVANRASLASGAITLLALVLVVAHAWLPGEPSGEPWFPFGLALAILALIAAATSLATGVACSRASDQDFVELAVIWALIVPLALMPVVGWAMGVRAVWLLLGCLHICAAGLLFAASRGLMLYLRRGEHHRAGGRLHWIATAIAGALALYGVAISILPSLTRLEVLTWAAAAGGGVLAMQGLFALWQVAQ